MLAKSVLGLVLSVVVSVGAAAQDTATKNAPPAEPEGRLNAFACGDLSVAQGVEIVLTDDSDPSRKLEAALRKTLSAENVRMSDTAPNLLTLDTRAIRQQAERRPRDMVEFKANPDTPSEQVRVNIWSNRSDSVLGGRREVIEKVAVNQLHVLLRVNAKSDGKCLWQGEAVVNLKGRDEWDVAGKIVPEIAKAIGTTVRNRPLSLD